MISPFQFGFLLYNSTQDFVKRPVLAHMISDFSEKGDPVNAKGGYFFVSLRTLKEFVWFIPCVSLFTAKLTDIRPRNAAERISTHNV